MFWSTVYSKVLYASSVRCKAYLCQDVTNRRPGYAYILSCLQQHTSVGSITKTPYHLVNWFNGKDQNYFYYCSRDHFKILNLRSFTFYSKVNRLDM